jgi:hypothetical protein
MPEFHDKRSDYEHATCICGWEITKAKDPSQTYTGVSSWWHVIPLGTELPASIPSHEPKPR